MSCMKKNFRIKLYLVFSIVIFIIVLLVIILSIIRKKDIYYYLTSDETYYLESSDTSFNVVFYSNHKEDVYVSQEAISNIFLKSHTCEDYYELNIKNVKEINNSIEYNDKTYYEKVLGLNLPLEVNEDYQVNDCYLEINYLSKEKIKLDIGSIIIYHSIASNHIEVSHMKAVVNTINNNELLVGIGLSLNSSENVKITSIKPLDNRIWIQSNKINKIIDDNYLNTINISELLDTEYNYLEKDNNDIEILLDKENKVHYIIPLGYEKLILTNKMGLRIEYEMAGIKYIKFIYPFTFFSSSNKVYWETKYEPIDNT